MCPQKQSGNLDVLRGLAPYLGLGLEMAVTILAALGFGYWVDGKLATRPIFLIVGGTLGIVAALYHFLKAAAGAGKL